MPSDQPMTTLDRCPSHSVSSLIRCQLVQGHRERHVHVGFDKERIEWTDVEGVDPTDEVAAAYERGKADVAPGVKSYIEFLEGAGEQLANERDEARREVERLQALLDHAEQYARDLQDEGDVEAVNRAVEVLVPLVHQFFDIGAGDNSDPVTVAIDVLREEIADHGTDGALRMAAYRVGVAEGRERGLREATEGWEREWGSRWTPPGGEPSNNVEIAYDEAEARHNAEEWLNHRAVSRLVGPWEPADQPEPVKILSYRYGPTSTDPNPGAMWCIGCGGEVTTFDGHAVCDCGAQLCESPEDCGDDACPYQPEPSPPRNDLDRVRSLQRALTGLADGGEVVIAEDSAITARRRLRMADGCGREHTYRDGCEHAEQPEGGA